MLINTEEAVSLLKSGNVVGLPTETVYGLAACLNQPQSIKKIFDLKKRPLVNPLIIHIAHQSEITDFALHFPPQFQQLANAFWPGPLTLILPIDQNKIPSIVRADLPTAGFRIPDQILTQNVLIKTGPLVMPSANLSGRPSSTQPEHVEEDFGKDFPVLDGGKCQRGLESTILSYKDDAWVIARMGAIAVEDFKHVFGYIPENLSQKNEERPICPGQCFRHYAPKARLYLGKDEHPLATHFLGFEGRNYQTNKPVLFFGKLKEPEEAASNLYDMLRQLDEEGITDVWIDMDFPDQGLWKTIAERLMRAAGG